MPDNILKVVGGGSSNANLNLQGQGGAVKINPNAFQTSDGSTIAAINTVARTAKELSFDTLAARKRREARDQKLWVQEQTIEARETWLQWLNDVENRDSETFDEDFVTSFEEDLTRRLEGAPSQAAKEGLGLRLKNFRASALPGVLQQTAVTRSQNTQLSIEKEIQSVSDTLPFITDLSSLEVEQATLATVIDLHIKDNSLSAEAGKAFKDQIADLTITYGTSLIGKNNELAEDVIKNAKGVDPNRRQAALRKVEIANRSFDDNLRLTLKQNLESDLAEARKFGTVSRTDFVQYEQVFGKVKTEEAIRLVDQSKRLFEANERLAGARPDELQDILKDFTVDKLSDLPVDEQVAMQEEVTRLVGSQVSLLQSDPYSYFSQKPEVINQLAQIDATVDTDAKTVLLKQVQDHIIKEQRLSGIPEGKLAVMSKSEAESWAAQINESVPTTDEKGVVSTLDVLMQLSEAYIDDNFFIAYKQLSNLPASKRVKPELLTALWHQDDQPMFEAVVNSLRKNDDEIMQQLRSQGKARDFNESVASNATLQKYRASLVIPDDSPLAQDMMNGTFNAFKAYARDRVVAGESVDQAANDFFSSIYDFDEVNGRFYSIRKRYRTETGEVRTFTEDQLDGLKAYLNSALETRFRQEELLRTSFSEILGEKHTKKDVERLQDMLESTAFWVTNSDETGVELFINGDTPGSLQRLKTIDGNPISISFEHIARPFQFKRPPGFDPRHQSGKTDDPWYLDLLRRIGNIK